MTVINVTNASEPTIISMGVLEVVKIDGNFLAYIAQAEAARTGSQTAQGLSEGARDASVAAKDLSIAGGDAALTAQGLSEGARDASITAQGLSEGARDISVAAKDNAVIAQGLAETAKGLAETARDTAQDWADANEDVEVVVGAYSAKHWSIKSEAWAGVAADPVAPHDINAAAHANLTARAPAAHAASHAFGATDAVTPAAIGAEPEIVAKGTAFNKNFGSASDTVCQGNDARLIVISATEPAAGDQGKLWFDGANFHIYEA